MTVQKAWFDADAHDRWVVSTWDEADDNSIQKQHQQKKSQSVCEKWDDDNDDHVSQKN